MGFFDFFSREKKETLDNGLQKTKQGFFDKIKRAVVGKDKVDDDVLDNLEEVLVTSDVGVETTVRIIERIQERVARDKYVGTDELNFVLKDEICQLLAENNSDDQVSFESELPETPYVIMVVGVNGVGKTTTIAKIAHRLKKEGKKVLLAAGDTFRAGAIDQLAVWAERVGVDIVTKPSGSDPSSVIYDAIIKAKEKKYDVVLCDTAGRLQNKANLMKELEKMHRVISREVEGGPHETILVIDATTGQNGLSQAEAFLETTQVSSVILTKLDGTSKGGIVLAIRDKYNIPIKMIGLGEKMEDLEYFDLEEYIGGLFIATDGDEDDE